MVPVQSKLHTMKCYGIIRSLNFQLTYATYPGTMPIVMIITLSFHYLEFFCKATCIQGRYSPPQPHCPSRAVFYKQARFEIPIHMISKFQVHFSYYFLSRREETERERDGRQRSLFGKYVEIIRKYVRITSKYVKITPNYVIRILKYVQGNRIHL